VESPLVALIAEQTSNSGRKPLVGAWEAHIAGIGQLMAFVAVIMLDYRR
jgi:hypothetical protein